MAGVLAAFGNMFAFKGSFQAEVRDWPVKGRVLRHGMEGHSNAFFLWCRDVVVELIYYAWFHACDSSRPSSRSQLPSVHNAQTITSVS